MRIPGGRAFACAILSVPWPATVAAQPGPERLVGTDLFGRPLVIRTLTAAEIGALAAAAHVPMGFEAAIPNPPLAWTIEATGRPLQAVLDAVLLNAIARSHGELCWIYEELNEEDTVFSGGRTHQISIRPPADGGGGFSFR